jgi:SAM-dependent methyltransferase
MKIKRKIVNSLLKNIEDSYIGKDNASNLNKWVKENLENLQSGLTLLDVGAGSAPYKKYCDHLNYMSHDFGEYEAGGDGTGLQKKTDVYDSFDLISDITSIELKDESVDIVLCTEVLEHIPDPIRAISEMTRILKVGGQIIITTPFNSVTHWSPFFFFPGISPNFYEEHLKEKYEITKLHHSGDYFSYIAQEIRRLPSVNNRYTTHKTSFIFEVAQRIILRGLNKMKDADTKSKELLCYGIFVMAKKIKS